MIRKRQRKAYVKLAQQYQQTHRGKEHPPQRSNRMVQELHRMEGGRRLATLLVEKNLNS